MSAGGLETYLNTGLIVIFFDGLTHHVCSLWRSGRFELACASLDIVGAGVHGDD